jgi:hypothetical protein
VIGLDGSTKSKTLAPYQADILSQFARDKRLAVRGLHGIGKTAIASWVVLWALSVFEGDVKVVTTASAWRQLTHYLWPEIRKWAQVCKWEVMDNGVQIRYGKELLEYSIKLNAKEAFPVASNNPSLIEGAHASTLVYVFDEAKAIPDETWDSAEGAFSTGNCYALAISTPGDATGRFYDIHSRKAGYEDWGIRHVTLDEAIAAGRVDADWAEKRRIQWGENSPVYLNRVLGEFSKNDPHALIPLQWVEESNNLWHEMGGKGKKEDSLTYGLDVAWQGDDKSSLARKRGVVVESLEMYGNYDPMELAGMAIVQMAGDKESAIAVDSNGIGAGVYARLNELGYNAVPCNVSEGTDERDESGELGFFNLRSFIWWRMRELLDPKNPDRIALPPDDGLTGDLTAPKWSPTSKGLIRVEGKEDIKKRLKRSTDSADAVGLAIYADIETQAWTEIW